jgi:TonB family protein
VRGSVFGSGLVHVLVVAVLFIVRRPVSLVVPGPDVIQVALLDPSAAITPPAPVETPEPEPATVAPVEEEGVKIETPKPTPAKPRPTPPPKARQNPAATLPSEQVGPAGLKGDVNVDTGDFEFTYYLVLIRNRIAGNWSPPAGMSTGDKVRAVVYFRVGRSGELSDIRIESASGVEFFDHSALRAVTISDPMPPLPLGFASGELGVHFGFDWEAP